MTATHRNELLPLRPAQEERGSDDTFFSLRAPAGRLIYGFARALSISFYRLFGQVGRFHVLAKLGSTRAGCGCGSKEELFHVS